MDSQKLVSIINNISEHTNGLGVSVGNPRGVAIGQLINTCHVICVVKLTEGHGEVLDALEDKLCEICSDLPEYPSIIDTARNELIQAEMRNAPSLINEHIA